MTSSALPRPLITDRLLLREFTEADWPAVYAYASDPAVTRYMFFPPRTEADSRAYIAQVLTARDERPRQTYELAVMLRDGGRLIGACDLTGEGEGIADIGYSLARDVWGLGYATEIVRALVAAGFGPLGLRRIIAAVAPENRASARVLEKAGFRHVAVARRVRFAKGRWWDMDQFALDREEWSSTARTSPPPEVSDAEEF